MIRDPPAPFGKRKRPSWLPQDGRLTGLCRAYYGCCDDSIATAVFQTRKT